jgi:hypothetical protein
MGVQRMRLLISIDFEEVDDRYTLGSSDDDGSTLGDVGDSSSGQEEGTVLLVSKTLVVNCRGVNPRCWSSWSCQTAR